MRARFVAVVVTIAVVLAASGCEGDSEMELQERAERRAVEARGYIDELVDLLGTRIELREDKLTTCVPGQEDSGLSLIYRWRVRIEPGDAQRLKTEIAEHFAERGWEVRRDPDNGDAVSVRFLKGTFAIGASLSEPDRLATVGGSMGCVT